MKRYKALRDFRRQYLGFRDACLPHHRPFRGIQPVPHLLRCSVDIYRVRNLHIRPPCGAALSSIFYHLTIKVPYKWTTDTRLLSGSVSTVVINLLCSKYRYTRHWRRAICFTGMRPTVRFIAPLGLISTTLVQII